jgi:hypothetical protein
MREGSSNLRIRLSPNFLNLIDKSTLENFVASRLFGLKHVLMSKDTEFYVFAILILTSQNHNISFDELTAKYDDLDNKMRALNPEPLIHMLEKTINSRNHLAEYQFCERPWF